MTHGSTCTDGSTKHIQQFEQGIGVSIAREGWFKFDQRIQELEKELTDQEVVRAIRIWWGLRARPCRRNSDSGKRKEKQSG